MKRFFIVLGTVLLMAIAFLLIAGLFVPKEYHFERSIIIHAPKEEVWKNIHLFSNIEKWDVKRAKDPSLKSRIVGKDGELGATYIWAGNHEVGNGQLSIASINPLDHVRMDLSIDKPYKTNAKTFFSLSSSSQGVKVTWGLDSEIPYPVNALAFFFMDPDELLDKDFSSGLLNLKKICEGNMTGVALIERPLDGPSGALEPHMRTKALF